jgi:hypothetical protein
MHFQIYNDDISVYFPPITSLLATAVVLASARTPKTHGRQLNEKYSFLI